MAKRARTETDEFDDMPISNQKQCLEAILPIILYNRINKLQNIYDSLEALLSCVQFVEKQIDTLEERQRAALRVLAFTENPSDSEDEPYSEDQTLEGLSNDANASTDGNASS